MAPRPSTAAEDRSRSPAVPRPRWACIAGRRRCGRSPAALALGDCRLGFFFLLRLDPRKLEDLLTSGIGKLGWHVADVLVGVGRLANAAGLQHVRLHSQGIPLAGLRRLGAPEHFLALIVRHAPHLDAVLADGDLLGLRRPAAQTYTHSTSPLIFSVNDIVAFSPTGGAMFQPSTAAENEKYSSGLVSSMLRRKFTISSDL